MRNFALNLLFRAFHSGRSYDGYEQHRKKRHYDAEKARVVAQRPAKLPNHRHNLSQALLSLHSQPLCPLFTRLPREIRHRIYRYILGNTIIHLTHISKHIVHHRLYNAEPFHNRTEEMGALGMRAPPIIEWISEAHRIPEASQFSLSSLSLLHTCHAIYAEAIEVLYAYNTYSMASPLVLLYIQDYTLRPQRFSQIQHLQLHWQYLSDPAGWRECIHEPYDFFTWKRFWEVAAGMQLRTLGLWIIYMEFERTTDCDLEDAWVRPMLLVHGLEKVELLIEYYIGGRERRTMAELEKAVTRAWLAN